MSNQAILDKLRGLLKNPNKNLVEILAGLIELQERSKGEITGVSDNLNSREGIHVSAFGAVGDGATDDSAAILAAIEEAYDRGGKVFFDAKIYAIASPIVITNFVSLVGSPRGGSNETRIKAITSMRSVFDLRTTVNIFDMQIDANRVADYGLYLNGCSFGTFERIGVSRALYDGVHLTKFNDLSQNTIDDLNRWVDFGTGLNGTLFLTPGLRADYVVGEGTPRVFPEQVEELTNALASVEDGSSTITFTGVDLTTLNLRPGDPMRVATGTDQEHFAIIEVLSSSTLRTVEVADVTASDLDFAIGRGDGYHEVEGDGDNNLSMFEGGLHRSNAGLGFKIHGSYGCRCYGVNIEYHPFWAVMLGTITANYVSTSISPLFVGSYFEGISRKPFYIASALGLGIYNIVGVEGSDLYDMPTGGGRGIRIGDSGVEPIGTLFNTVPSKFLHDGQISGHTTFIGTVVQPINASGSNDFGSSYWLLRGDSNPVTCTGTPTLTLRPGKYLIIENEGPNDVTFQDESQLPGSKFKLAAAAVTLTPYKAVQFICDGNFWVQLQ